jgi:hypothetical protein
MYAILRAHQSSPYITLMILGSGSIIFIDASNMICRKTSAGKGVTPRLPSTPFAEKHLLGSAARETSILAKQAAAFGRCRGLVGLDLEK